jgi:hypothetical protein
VKRREIIEAVLFLPAMALLAGAVFGVMWLIIQAGNAAVYGWHDLLRGLGLPFPAALAFAVMLAAVTVYAFFYWAGKRRQRPRT